MIGCPFSRGLLGSLLAFDHTWSLDCARSQ
jgi:hypothetical protein